MKKAWLFLFIAAICGCTPQTQDAAPAQEAAADIAPATLPEPNVLLIEQAVDAWLFFNLPDFKNYEAIIRSTDHEEGSNIYIHHLRYRYMNQTGGYVTVEQSFSVDTSHPGDNSIPYAVTPLPD